MHYRVAQSAAFNAAMSFGNTVQFKSGANRDFNVARVRLDEIDCRMSGFPGKVEALDEPQIQSFCGEGVVGQCRSGVRTAGKGGDGSVFSQQIGVGGHVGRKYTALWARLGTLDLDLVLVPAKTDMITGYNRVFGSARSRATELQTLVCAVGAVGVLMGDPASDTGVGGAAAYVPCDVSVSLDGVFAALLPQHASGETNLVLPVRDLPVGLCRRIRNGAAEAEVNPASWSARHLTIKEA